MRILQLILTLLLLTTTFYCVAESRCFGTTADGRLEAGVNLPVSGENFEPYSRIARAFGRTYVHSEVNSIFVDAYKKLASNAPKKRFMYAESGNEMGGEFYPHKTHQNGLSVDFMVPVVNEKGESVYLPTNLFNKFGYDLEFSETGDLDGYQIDFEAMALHIQQLHLSAKARGVDLWRVIFDPVLQPYLFETSVSRYLKENVEFSKKRSWVRHDEHYHVDFEVQCEEAS